jgi:hypothetical protein
VIVDALLARKVPADATFWLDHGRRHHRLRRDGETVIAEHRDGRSFRLPWLADEPLPDNAGFAARIFNLAAQTKMAAGPTASDQI